MPHDVTAGLISGNEIEILAGLEPGMEVVSSANFLIDAESNMGASLSSVPRLDTDTLAADGGHAGH
jgi:hypothetical protein